MEKLYNILIVKYGEIGVKGKNRYIFENKLIKNVKTILKPIGKFNVYKEYGRIYVDLDGYDYEEVVEEVKKVFGIVGVCPAVRAEKDLYPCSIFSSNIFNANSFNKL